MPARGDEPQGLQSAPIANTAGGVWGILPRIGKGDCEFARRFFGKMLFVDILSLDMQHGTVPVRSGNSFLPRPLRRRHTSVKKLLWHLRIQAERFFDRGKGKKRDGG